MFGKNIKKIRSVHGLSQQQFAEMFDLKRATLGAYEEGRSNPKMETVIKIANNFSIDLEDLLTKELTVNRLLKFNEAITTSPATPVTNDFESILCVTQQNEEAFLNALKNKGTIELPKIMLPHVSGKDKMAFTVNDLTMSGATPAYLPKDTIVAEQVPLTALEALSGSLVVVATATVLLFRKMEYRGDTLLLKANHQGIEPIEIATKDITGLWQVVHAFHYTLPNENEVEKRLALLESTLAALSKNL